jgi:hypothetical protein
MDGLSEWLPRSSAGHPPAELRDTVRSVTCMLVADISDLYTLALVFEFESFRSDAMVSIDLKLELPESARHTPCTRAGTRRILFVKVKT